MWNGPDPNLLASSSVMIPLGIGAPFGSVTSKSKNPSSTQRSSKNGQFIRDSRLLRNLDPSPVPVASHKQPHMHRPNSLARIVGSSAVPISSGLSSLKLSGSGA